MDYSKRLTKTLSVAVIAIMLLASLVVIAGNTQGAAPALTLTEKQGVGATEAPSEPLNLVVDQGPGFNWLWWDHPATQGSDLIKTYEIWRGTSSGSETFHDWIYVGSHVYNATGTFLGNVNFYNDSYDITLDQQYFYEIVAVSDAGSSAPSAEVTATPSLTGLPPNAPTISGLNEVYSAQLNWTVPTVPSGSPPARFYFLYRDPGFIPGFPITLDEWSRAMGYVDEASFLTQLGTLYTYTVIAANTYGMGAGGQVDVTIGGTGTTPSAPQNLTAVGLNQSAYLFWDPPSNPSADGFDSYAVYRATSSGGPFTYIGNVTDVAFFGYIGFFADSNLTNGQTYYYEVQANNSFGSSPRSNEANATPTAFPPSPFEVTVLNAYPGDSRALLLWSPAFNSTFSAATGYDIYRSTVSGGETLFASVGQTAVWFDNNVSNGLTYYYYVVPTIGAQVGQASPEASVTPGPGSPPSAPTGLTATPDSDGVMLYLPSALSTSIFLGYEIYRGDSSGAESATPIANVTSYSFDAGFFWTDLTAQPDVNYFYTVKTRDMFGTSPASNEATSFASPTGDQPDAVSDLTATGHPGYVQVSWSMPTYQGTAILLGYTVYRNDTLGGWESVGFVYGTGSGSLMDSLVVPGVTYTYRVLAENNYGEADTLSNAAGAAATSSNQPPSAPLSPEAHSGVGYVLLTWDVPASSGSSAIARYDVYRGTTSGGEGTTPIGSSAADTLQFNDTTGTPGTTYYYVVKAVNGQGSSPASTEVSGSASAPPSVPSAPQNLETAAHDGYVILTWDAPASEGSSPITGYNVYRGTSAGSLGTTPIGTTLPGTRTFNDSTVTNGVTYYYGVRAVNAVGTGPVSNVVPATPSAPGVAPAAPTNPSANGMTGSIFVEWDPPANYPGVPVTYYLVYRGTTAGGEEANPIKNQTGTSFSDVNVTVGTPYYYEVRAGNQFGLSGYSEEVFATASQTANTPSAPTGVKAVVSPGQIVLNWTAPANNGGSAITGYKVYRTVNGSAASLVTTLPSTASSYTDSVGVGEYTYYVVATNANGDGANSAVVEASGQAPSGGGGGTDYTPLIIGIVIVVIILIIIAAVLMRRRK